MIHIPAYALKHKPTCSRGKEDEGKTPPPRSSSVDLPRASCGRRSLLPSSHHISTEHVTVYYTPIYERRGTSLSGRY